jgi:hypothetical protein
MSQSNLEEKKGRNEAIEAYRKAKRNLRGAPVSALRRRESGLKAGGAEIEISEMYQ